MTTNDELEGLRVSEAIRQGILIERDELRAENERLREEYDDALTLVEVWKAREAKARAEVEQLREQVAAHHSPGFVCQS